MAKTDSKKWKEIKNDPEPWLYDDFNRWWCITEVDRLTAECERLRGLNQKCARDWWDAKTRAEKVEVREAQQRHLAEQNLLRARRVEADLSACKERVRECQHALVQAGVILEALHASVRWELAEDIRAEIADKLPIIRAALQAQEQTKEVGG